MELSFLNLWPVPSIKRILLIKKHVDFNRRAKRFFIKKKVELIESKVSEKFGGIRFKLFETLINGGLSECCETLIDGVPFSVLSNGKKIKCGLKIIEVLQKHFDLKAPVFVDNAEGVTSKIELDTQLILLFADEHYKNLEVINL